MLLLFFHNLSINFALIAIVLHNNKSFFSTDLVFLRVFSVVLFLLELCEVVLKVLNLTLLDGHADFLLACHLLSVHILFILVLAQFSVIFGSLVSEIGFLNSANLLDF